MPFKHILLRFLNRPDGHLTYGDRHRIAALLSMLPVPLPRILRLFGSDKQKAGEHSYGETYERLLRERRYRRLKILEIGLLSGSSLLAWRAYFPWSVTVGLDIQDRRALAVGSRTRVYQGDQSAADDIARLCAAEAPFDIVIDDGSHQCEHQLATFLQVFPHLRNDGQYVIEDVQTSFWTGSYPGYNSGWGGRRITDPDFASTCYGWFLELAKYLNHSEFETLDGVDRQMLALGQQIRRITFEHNMIIIEKGPNFDPSNVQASWNVHRAST